MIGTRLHQGSAPEFVARLTRRLPAATHPVAQGIRRPSILVLRSSRQPQFRRAMLEARERYPDASISVLTHVDFAETVRQDGVDQVVTYRSRRMGLLHLPRAVTRALRRRAFDAVVIPQMTSEIVGAANLYRLAWWTGAPEVLVVAGDEAARLWSRSQIAILGWWASIPSAFDAGFTLALLMGGWVRRCARTNRQIDRSRPMRVLHVIDSLGMGGAQVQLAELANRLSSDRYEVEVLALSGAGAFATDRFRSSVSVHTLAGPLSTAQRILAVRELCRRKKYDLVHAWLSRANVVAPAAAGLAGIPRIVLSVRSLNPGHYPESLQWWHRLADLFASRIADAVTVNAHALAPDYGRWVNLPARRIRVVHNGIDETELPASGECARAWLRDLLGLPLSSRIIGTAGRLDREKDQATFLRTVARLLADGQDLYAVVVGDGPLREPLAAMASALNLPLNRLRWLGPRSDARRVIAGLDVFVLTSKIEGFPNVLLEAAFLGVPFVASDVGGVSEIPSDRAGLFAPGDDRAAAALVAARLASDRSIASTRQTRERCEQQFSAAAMVARWQAVYES